MSNLIWRPQPKQAIWMSRPEFEALYGGAAGGGKSDAMIIEALRQVHIPHYKGLILRKTYRQLTELVDKSLRYYPQAVPGAKYNGTRHEWTFPSGAKVIFGGMQHSKDRLNYQGQAYDFIGFDELTQFTWEEYDYLFSRCRPNGAGTRCYIRATANPGGVGHGWVKQRFITAGAPMQTIWEDIAWRDKDGKEHKKKQSRIYIPASVFDNPKLLENDPDYIVRLASMNEAEKNALLYGDWDSFSGQVFTEWRNDAAHYEDRVNTHVIKPFLIPQSWKVYRGFDWGYSRPFSVGWFAVDMDGRLYHLRELYGCTGEPNVGVKWEAAKIAQEIKRIESEDPNLKGRKIYGVADPAIFADSTGTGSIADTMSESRVYWDAGQHDRINGKMQIHHRLAFNEDGVPMFYCFSTCKHFIRTFPSLVYDETDVEDVDTDGEDHAYDMFRYVAMENPIAAPMYSKAKLKEWSPFDDEPTEYDHYNFFRRY